MDQAKDTRSSIVIIEAGAGWPTWISDYQRRAPQAAVVAQTATDSLPVFRERVERRIAEIEKHGSIRVGIVVCADARDPERAELRRELGQRIVNALASTGDLVLAATEDCDDRFKHELVALAGELCESRAGTRVSVRARFATGKSGTMPTVVSVAPPAPEREATGSE